MSSTDERGMVWIVKGHQSAFAFGFLGSNRVPVVCQLGRYVPLSPSPVLY
jgi:hypothetical protein